MTESIANTGGGHTRRGPRHNKISGGDCGRNDNNEKNKTPMGTTANAMTGTNPILKSAGDEGRKNN
eukprot:3694170-Lingulodinium_polyedra.AAC.1